MGLTILRSWYVKWRTFVLCKTKSDMRITKWTAAMLAVVMSATACSKNEDSPPVDTISYNKLITVSNFNGDTTTSKTLIYFSLEKQSAASPKEAALKTGDWDIAFGGAANTTISGNFGANTEENTTYGKGGPGLGGVALVNKPWNEVTKVPEGIVFSTKSGGVGLDSASSHNASAVSGWAVYDASGIMRTIKGIGGNNAATQKHTVWSRPDRTIIVRTASGLYAKLRIISMYKDAPAEPEQTSPMPFVKFEYVIAARGTMDFTIKP